MDDGYTTDSISPPTLHNPDCHATETLSHGPSTSVHTRTLTVDPPSPDTTAQDHRFRHHLPLRAAWKTALRQTRTNMTHAPRFENCGQNCWIQYSPARDTYRTVANSCNLRICPICGDRIRRETAEKAAANLDVLDPSDRKLITLTLKSSAAPLVDQVTRLKACFRRLRQRHIWTGNVTAGFAVIEFTFNAKIRHWHPHIHIVCNANYIPHAHLKNHWLSITKTSTIVDIRPCHRGINIAHYLAKYLGKPPALSKFDNEPNRLLEFRTALDRSRMLIRFGKFPEQPDVNPPDDDCPNDWQQYAPFETVLQRLREHDPTAFRIFSHLSHDTGFARTPFGDSPQHSDLAVTELAIENLHPP